MLVTYTASPHASTSMNLGNEKRSARRATLVTVLTVRFLSEALVDKGLVVNWSSNAQSEYTLKRIRCCDNQI